MPKPTRGGTIVNTKSVKIDAATLRKKLPRLGSAAETVAAALSDAATAASSERAPLYLDAWAKGEKVPALAARKSPPTLRGRVTGIGDGTGRAGMTVRVFAKGLTSDESLGETKTGRRGDYALVYKREGTRALDLVVSVFGAGTAPLAQSPILYNARWTEIVDLTVDSTEGLLSEYQALAEKAGPLLNGGSAANLTEKEIDYLSGKTNEPELHLAYYVLAHRHARNTGVRPETFYGLFRLGFPTALPALLAQPPQQLKDALALCAQRAICPAGLEPDADRLHAQAPDRILSSPQGSPRALLAIAGLNVDEQKAFVSAYTRQSDSTETFWNSFVDTPLAGKINDLKNVIEMGQLTGDNAPLVQTLRARGFRTARDLAGMDRTALQTLLESSDDILNDVPPVKEGELKSEKSARVAGEILGTLNDTFPTAVFAPRLAESAATPAAKDAARLLANAPDLELRDDDIDGFLLREGDRVFAGVGDRTGAVDHLKKCQRLMRVAPQAEHLDRLLREGFGSAREMAGLSERAFVEKFGSIFGEDHAKTYHRKARQTCSDLALMATGVLQAVNDAPLAAVGLPSAQLKTMPTLAGLFGSFGLCECKDCRSVYSPAAYLVDLLEFINPKAGPKPIQFLRLRRPDLEHIPLTCENTNTVLPAVDLANEVFEYFTANGALATGAARDTTGATSEELGVTPQYTLQTAYQVLQTAAAAPLLPFHRSLESARLSLAQMGTSRHELMGAFQKNGAPSSLETDLEFLSISRAERDILTGMDPRPMREFFGYGSDQATRLDEGGSLGQEFWEDNIRRVPEFLRRTGTTFQDLSWVIGSRLLNVEEPRMFLGEKGGVPTGDLTKTEIVHLTAVRLEKIHRFLRLVRKTGWTLTELEEAMGILQSAEINDALLRKIAAAKRLESELKRPPMVLFSLWGPLSTRGKPSLYSQLFENKAVCNPVDPDFALTDTHPFLASGKTLGEKTPLLLAAFRLNDADLSRIREAAGLAGDDAPLTLATLSALHRYTVLARALKLTLKDFLALVDLLGLDPFQSGAPDSTALFVKRAKNVLSSGLTLPELTSLFRSEGAAPAETNAAIAAIRDGLAKIAEETAAGPDPAGDRMRARLAAALPPEALAEAFALIDGTGGPSDPEGFIETQFAPWTDVQEAKAILLDPAPADPEERKDKNRVYVLSRLLAHARRAQSREFVIQFLGTTCGMELPAMNALLSAGLRSSLDGSQFALTDFLALSDPSMSTTAAERTFRRLRKAAVVIDAFDLTDREIDFLARHPKKAGGFDLNSLPVDPGPADHSIFSAWEQSLGLFQLRSRWPREKGDVVDLLSAETRGAALDALLRASGWNTDHTIHLANPEGFDLALADLQSVGGLGRMERALSVARRTGLPPAALFAQAEAEPSFERADLLLNAVKAQHDAAQWPAVAKPIGDALREKCHAALVSHILTLDAVAKKKIFTAEGLFAYFLIDAEMTAGPKTSRIKQAIASVQLFIQRCLMNLETGVAPSAIDADQWEWMKNYRVWEANRKVFLYPENWIEPELRDDKTPLFRELESQLMQNDLSADTAEAAFLSYLEKLDGVSNLDVLGFFTEEEPGQPAVTHVVGRTPDVPHVHYYRRRVEGRGWTPWEKIDMDVDGDHILPRVHNNRLYLFWFTFEEKPDKEKMLEGPFLQSQEHWQWVQDHQSWREEHNAWQAVKDARDAWESMLDAIQKAVDPFLNDEQMEEFVNSFSDNAPPEPGEEPQEPTEPQRGVDPVMTRWEIKLHWTENKNGKWSPKRSSQETVQSHFVWRTLEDWQEEQGVADLGDLGTKDTVAAVFLPSPENHYFRTSLSNGRLRITVYRRFAKSFPVLNAGEVTAQAHQAIGAFQFHEGAKVRATQLFGPLDYAALKKPAKTTNRSQQFADTGGQAFTFVPSDGSPHPVFETLPAAAGKYALTVEHQFNEFKMGSPFHPFFFQNKLGTYMAYEKWDLPADAPGSRGRRMALGFSFGAEEDFISPYRTRSLSWPSEKRAMFTGKGRSLASLRRSGSVSLSGIDPSRLEASTGEERMDLAAVGVFETGLPAFAGRRRIPGSLSFLKPFLKFDAFFHPQTGSFMSILYQKGVPGLLARATQALDNDTGPQGNLFKARYRPTALVHRTSPREHVDFGAGAYAVYNWELFFHVPFLIALALGKNQRFEEAAAWFHLIFNPMTASNETAPGRYWNTLPFFKNTTPEEDQPLTIFQVLSSTDPARADRRAEMEEQIQRWREDPFNPHLIARLRITAYQKNVVMKYIDHLIQRGDQLFRMDTLESINEATLVYVLAHDLMGRRPVETPSPVAIDPKSYHQLKGEGLDAFSNALVSFENALPYSPPVFPTLSVYSQKSLLGKTGKARFAPVKSTHAAAPLVTSAPETFYFCLPKNDRLLKMWDTLEDRLFKIRHSLNIDGVARELPLFEPPIDPALLVKAAAAGVNLSSALSDATGPFLRYRFGVMVQKALDLCAEVKSLGAALLSALEKKDGELLAQLRAGHETALMKAVRDVKRRQVEEADSTLASLRKSKVLAETRRDYYRDIDRISGYEQENMDSLDAAHVFSQIAQGVAAGASGAHITPNFEIGTNGWAATPKVTAMFGGDNLGNALEAISKNIAMISAQFSHEATMASIRGGYDRRWKEWKFQEKLAQREMDQIDKQLLGAEIRRAIAEKELETHDQQIENASSVESHWREKYTNADLYGWMQGEIARVYFQAYKLAYDLAKRAEQAFRFEAGVGDSRYIQFGYWDDLRRGLMAGEKLFLDLKRLETAHLEQNRREFEIVKQVSLTQLDPSALIRLKETGVCEMELPEALFDMDYPGHYMRRIKSVALTLPCVAGPHAGVHCTLTLLSAKTRRDPTAQGDYGETVDAEDPRFDTRFGGPASVATSHGRNDAGLFEVNFRDERYLPFEGAGAVSRWRLALPKETNAFDVGTLSDVILHVHYTSRDGGDLLRRKAMEAVTLASPREGLTRFFSARHEFPDGWHRFLHETDTTGSHSLSLDLTAQRFPFPFRGKTIDLQACDVVLKLKPGAAYENGANLSVDVQREGGSVFLGREMIAGALFNLPAARLFGEQAEEPLGTWKLTIPSGLLPGLHPSLKKQVIVNNQPQWRLNPDAIDDLWILARYRVTN